MFEALLYSNIFVHYERLFTSSQKLQLFKHFKPLNGSFSVVSLSVLEDMCISLQSPFPAELNGFCANSVY